MNWTLATCLIAEHEDALRYKGAVIFPLAPKFPDLYRHHDSCSSRRSHRANSPKHRQRYKGSEGLHLSLSKLVPVWQETPSCSTELLVGEKAPRLLQEESAPTELRKDICLLFRKTLPRMGIYRP